jgi:hypothetical protein
MRDELASAVAGLFADELQEPPPLTEDEFQRLDNVVALVVRLRAHVNQHRARSKASTEPRDRVAWACRSSASLLASSPSACHTGKRSRPSKMFAWRQHLLSAAAPSNY